MLLHRASKSVWFPLANTWLTSRPAALMVLLVGVMLTVGAAAYVARAVEQEDRAYFERRVVEAHAILNQHLRLNVEVLRGLQGLFLQAGTRPVSREGFRRYVNHLELAGRYPGLHALTFTRYMPADQLPTFEAAVRHDAALNQPNFSVKPAGSRADYFVLDYVGPDSEANAYAFGLDLGSEVTRRQAFEQARDTGRITASGRITLTMREGSPMGFHMGAPVYRSGAPLTSIEERRRALQGWVTAVFRSEEMFSGLFGGELLKELDIEVFDAQEAGGTVDIGAQSVLFDSAVEMAGHSVALHATAAPTSFRATRTIELAGRKWSVVYTALPSLAASDSRALLPRLVLGAGAVLSLLLFALIASISTTNRRLASEVGEQTATVQATHRELSESERRLTDANRDLEAAQHQLIQADKMASLGQLAAGVAHEINNPVGFINSNLSSLKRCVNDLFRVIDAYALADPLVAEVPEIRDAIAAAKTAAELDFLREDIPASIEESLDGALRVKKIVTDLKDFSRVDNLEWGHANLERGIDSTLSIVWNELKYKAEVIKEYGQIPDVECLGSQINQVVMNLLVNAAHAIETRGTITIRTGADQNKVWIEIADTGKGIPPEIMKRIFEPFFTTKPVGVGTGLGLTIAYGIVRRHRGTLEVGSEVGRGTCFRLTIPREQAPDTMAV